MTLHRQGLAVERLAVALLWAGALTFVFALWLTYGRPFNNYPPAKLEKMLEGGASRPFSGRVLLPWTVRALASPISADARSAWGERLASTSAAANHALNQFGTPPRFALELLLAIALDALALALFAFVLSRLFDELFVASRWVRWTAPPLAVLSIPLLLQQADHYFYDLPAMLFAAWVLLALLKGRVATLYALVFLGTLNKETMLLAPLAFLLPEVREAIGSTWKRHLAGVSATALVARALALGLSQPAAGEAAGGYLPKYLVGNAFVFARDPFLVDAKRFAAALVFLLVIFGGWRRKPRFLVRLLPVTLPMTALYLIGGQWGEIRALGELLPLVFLLGYQTVVEWIGLEIRPRDAAESMPISEPRTNWSSLAAAGAAALAGSFLLASGVLIFRMAVFGIAL